jgi:hypothetical protein
MRSFSKIIPVWLAILCPLVALGAEADPFVKITSPKSGIVVRAGERLTMTVDTTPNAFDRVIALGLAAWSSSSGPPYDLAIRVPSNIDSGPITVVVTGVPPSGLKDVKSDKDVVQDEIELDVERVDSPESIKGALWNVHNGPPGFQHIGEIRALTVTGVFGDGTEVELSRSKLTVYICSPESVVKVDGEGNVTAIGHGRAKITIRNGNATVVVPVSVP